MKPKEFDELVRQKFDQNDFAYEPANWDSLAEKMDGRAKKRNAIAWWWVPLAGMAASVAFAMGSTSLLRHSISTPGSVKTELATKKALQQVPANNTPIVQMPTAHTEVVYAANSNNANRKAATGIRKHEENVSDWFHVRLNENTLKHTSHTSGQTGSFDFLAASNTAKPKAKKEEVIAHSGYNTFREEEETGKKVRNLSVSLLGGYYQGSLNTGYTGGAAIRKMLNDKVYIESDVAFTSSSNSQLIPHATYTLVTTGGGINASGARHSGAKGSSNDPTSRTQQNQPVKQVLEENKQIYDENYNLYYAQVSPSIGYKVIRRLAIGVGPDFQQMLIDNRPTITNNVDRGNIQVTPTFDVGFIGKSEFLVTKRMKAAVSYRKGINNILTPMDKYIDRDYLQFQVRCTIFNK